MESVSVRRGRTPSRLAPVTLVVEIPCMKRGIFFAGNKEFSPEKWLTQKTFSRNDRRRKDDKGNRRPPVCEFPNDRYP